MNENQSFGSVWGHNQLIDSEILMILINSILYMLFLSVVVVDDDVIEKGIHHKVSSNFNH